MVNRFNLWLTTVLVVFVSFVYGTGIPCESTGTNIELQGDPEDCQQFIVCVLDVGMVVPCPNETYFDLRSQTCDEFQNVECYGKGEGEKCHPGCLSGAKKVAHDKDCNKFITCDECKTESCSAGLHFNPILEVCDTPNHAECLHEICSDVEEGIWVDIASVNSCTIYYTCFGSTVLPRLCGVGTFFNPESNLCEIESLENPCTVDRLPTPPLSVIELCTPDTELISIPHPDDPTVYFQCLNGNLAVHRCPTGLVFDETLQQCNLPLTV